MNAILIVLVVGVVVLLVSKRSRDVTIGICESVLESASQKEERKHKILSLLKEKSEISNADIRVALGVSSRTAVRYLDELEQEGKVEQVGITGHAVTYRVKA